MKIRYLIPLLFLGTLFAQNSRYDSVALGPKGPIPFATVAICTQPANSSTQPCSPLANLCSSLSDVTCNQPNPLTADVLGNYHAYVKSSQTPFTVQVYGPQVAAPLVLPDQNVPGSGAITNLNGILFANQFTSVQAAINALPGSGGVVYIPCGTYAGPTSIPSNVSIISLCAPFNQDQGQSNNGVTAQTIFTYNSALTIQGEVNVRLQGITLDFHDTGGNFVLTSDSGFNFSYVNIHECGNTTTPCLVLNTSCTTNTCNCNDNYFDHITIKPNTSSIAQNATGLLINGQGAVASGSVATLNYFDNIVISGNLRNGIDFELNSDTNYFQHVQLFQLLASPVANTAALVFNNATPGSDQDSNGELLEGVNYTGAAWTTIRAGQTTGNQVSFDQSSTPTFTVAGGTPNFSFRAIGLGGFHADQLIGGKLAVSAAGGSQNWASTSQTGDITVSRSSTTGSFYLGTDGLGFLFRNGTNSMQLGAGNTTYNFLQLGTTGAVQQNIVGNLGSLAACSASIEGFHATANNCNAACSAGGTCTAGGATHCELYCNGTTYKETGN